MNKTSVRNPVRICFVIPKAYPLFNPQVKSVFGGAEVDLYLLATELKKDKDFAVSFITADYGQNQTETISGVKIIKSLDFKKNVLSGAIRLWRAMRQADADIYMLKTASPGVPLAAVFCRLYKKIFVYRTAAALECNGTYNRQHFFLGKAFEWSLRRADIVFAQNVTDKENLQRTLGVSAVVIPNGHIMPPLVQYSRDTILWVGRSDKIKRPELFIDLAQKMPDEKFTMICQHATGDTDYDTMTACAKAVKNLEFVERVPFAEIDGFFQHAKVFVNTSDAEGFPNTFIQACKYAVPIVSLNVNPDSFLDKYNCGKVCDGNLSKCAEMLQYMFAENRYIDLGKNARKYVEQNHDITKIVHEYKRIFDGLLQCKRNT